MQYLQQFLDQLKQLWQGVSLPGRVGLVLLTVVCVAAIVGVGIWAARPDYRVLSSSLSGEDAAAVTANLQSQAIPYRLSGSGTTVLVPASQIDQARLALAAAGLPLGSGPGLEMFDSPRLGSTPFSDHVNYTRALQSELARTITEMVPVVAARVHIVLPDPTPFIRDQKPPTASVMLRLRPTASLSPEDGANIVALVAGAVEGLDPESVTLMDTNGRLLYRPPDSESSMQTNNQLDYQRAVEDDLVTKAEEMLEKLLGPGRAVVKVTAEVNFTRRKETRKSYDPDERVVKSEREKNRTTTTQVPRGVPGTASNLGTPQIGTGNVPANEQETDIEIEYVNSEWVEELEEQVGDIQRLTVSAFIDLPQATAGESGQVAPTITKQEAEEILKRAVGFKDGRDDIQVTITSLVSAGRQEVLDTAWQESQRWEHYIGLARSTSLGIAALAALFVGWRVVKQLQSTAVAGQVAESQHRAKVLDRLATEAQRNPQAVARLLAMWLERSEEQPQEPKAAA